MQNSHRKSNAQENADHAIIFIEKSTNEVIRYTTGAGRYSHRHKRYSILNNFVPSEETYVEVVLVDYMWTGFRSFTLCASVPTTIESTFERCGRNHFS